MSFIGALGYNTFDKETDDVIINTSNHIFDTSNVISNHILDTSNIITNYIFDTSNIISNHFLDTSNYTSSVNLDSSNYTGRINQELSDRIGFPAVAFPLDLPTGVYFLLKTQELILADVRKVVGLHTIAIAGIEEQIIALVGTGGIICIITGGTVCTALTTATNANNTANSANTKVDNLITSTTTDKLDTSNYILNTSNSILQYLEILPYEKLSVPLKDANAIGFIIPPITSEPIIDIDDDYKYIAINTINTNSSLVGHYKFDDDFKDSSGNNRHLTQNQNLPVISNTHFKYGNSSYFTSDSLKLQNVVDANGVLTSGYTFHNKAFSISLWLYSTTGGNFISQPKISTQNQALHIIYDANRRYTFGFWSNDLDTTAQYPEDLNNWVHLVFQIDSSRRREIWRNGVLVRFVTSSAFLNTENANIVLGSWNTSYINGYMDAVRIYDRELTETEILQLYHENDTPKTPEVINFPEETEISLLILDNLKYVETDPFLFSGIANTNIGDTTSFNEYNTNINSTPYNSGFLSGITGTNITYNTPQVIIKYKYTKPIIIQVPNEGYLNYKTTGWEVRDIVGDTSNLIQDTFNYINFTNNILSTFTNEQLDHTSNYVISTSNILESNINTKIQNNSNLLATDTNLKIFNTSNYILSSIQTKGESTSNHITYTSNILTLDTSNYIITTSNILANADTLIENELNILENILLPTGKTFLLNEEKTLLIGYKDRNSLNYPAIPDAFIIPLKQVDKVIDDNNAISVLNYIIYRPFLYVFANILQVNETYSMVRGVATYLLDNNNTTFSFTKKLSITNGFIVLYNLYDIGDNSLNYTRTANNLNLTFKQQTTRDFLTTNFYLNNPSLTLSCTSGALWIIPNSIFSNWNVTPRRYSVPNVNSQQC